MSGKRSLKNHDKAGLFSPPGRMVVGESPCLELNDLEDGSFQSVALE